MIHLPIEIINIIYSYCQGATNQIMKTHILNVASMNEFIKIEKLMIYILKKNKEYNYRHYDNNRFLNTYYDHCSYCKRYLSIYDFLNPIYSYGVKICYHCNLQMNSYLCHI